MKIPLLDLQAQFKAIKHEVLPAVLRVAEGQHFIMGELVERLEVAIAELAGASHGIACASGTDALLLSLKALRLEPGDEVITTPFTFFATAGAICNAGGRPVFVDVKRDTFNIDVEQAAAAVTDRTRAIVPVHLFGQMAEMDTLLALAARHGLDIIEDAAQAIGASRLIDDEWRAAGGLGLTGAFSFFPSKNLGCWGDGGLMVTGDAELAARMRKLRTHGGAKQYHHEEVGINSRLDAIQAAVLLVKLPHLAAWTAARQKHADRYSKLLQDVDAVECPLTDTTNRHVYHQYTVRAERRDELKKHLAERGIGSAVYYPRALHMQPCFADLGYVEGQLEVSERACDEVLSLPIYPELTEQEQEIVVDAVREFYQ